MDTQIKDVVIVGGGSAGWISAAALAKIMGPLINITLVESDAIGIVGVGEATIPQIQRLNAILGIEEKDFLSACKATIKLGIEFNNWGGLGQSYLHTFGETGINLGSVHFHHYWLRARKTLDHTSSLWDYSLHNEAAYRGKFAHLTKIGSTSMTGLAYAYHFDAGLYAQYLRNYSEKRGVKRIEGIVNRVEQNTENGIITSITLEDGKNIKGDLFLDCTGFRGLLISKTLNVPYKDWSHYLPCDRAWAVPSQKKAPIIPFTKSTAHSAGWQWRIPLQHRTGNGHVFSSSFMAEETARQILLDNLDAPALDEPRMLKFTTGYREKCWEKNCISIGLSSGFLEPLESTSIHLIQSHINRLIGLFPDKTFSQSTRHEYNRQVADEFELIRDFLILHYRQTTRDDSEFWNYCRTMPVPDSLTDKIDLFRESGRIYRDPEDLFRDSSWVQVMMGQGIMPDHYHPIAGLITDTELTEFLTNVRKIVVDATAQLPSHEDFISQY
ncbi:MAG: tryptophan halogenase family protein [bacterium]